ncbi:MAG: carotenoid oxygenase family protein [Pseudomonadales bacterium]|nr:carotenoid oxygenase family protein [Pseudomonadales bacterium]
MSKTNPEAIAEHISEKSPATINALVQNDTLAAADNPVLQGNFAPVNKELTLENFAVVGHVPEALNGTLLRDGPNPVDPQANHHWFNGDGMLHAIKFENGRVSGYRNRWLRTEALAKKTGLQAASVKGTKQLVQGTGNVNVIAHGDKILALPELGLPYEVDLALATKGLFDYSGRLKGSMTAHPKIDPETGEMLFFGYEMVPPFVNFHCVNSRGELTRSVPIELPKSIMMHDFGVTATRVIFMDLPVVFDFQLVEQGVGMPFAWDDKHQARLGIMDRDSTSGDVTWIDIEPCYVFHPMNSYDDDDNIIMDVVRYEKTFTRPEDKYERSAQLIRWTINVAAGTVDSTLLCDVDQEFPRINPAYECYPYRYGYVVEVGGAHGFKGLLKVDHAAGSTEVHAVGIDKAASEPIFVAAGVAASPASAQGEDAGFILTVVYDAVTHLSELHIIDAQNFTAEAVAIIKLGARIPFGFHGNFVPA